MKKMPATFETSCAALSPEGAAAPGGGPSVRRRNLLLAAGGTGLLAGCGFHLRQAPDFVFTSMVLNAPESSPLAAELRRQMAANAKVEVLGPGATVVAAAAGAAPAAVPEPQRGRVVFDLLQEQREKVVVGLNASGQVREFQLRLRIRFRLRGAQGKELIPDTELLQQRDISFNEGAVLAKEAEEALLYRDMQRDLVQQLMRRLAALKTL
jgi:LPS-assembly lipoprotein